MKNKIIVIFIAGILLAGCGPIVTRDADSLSAASGGGGYSLKKILYPDGRIECNVEATSAREITGAKVVVGENCSLEASIDKTSGSEVQGRLMEKLLDRLIPLNVVP